MKEMKTETVFQDYEAPQVEVVEVEKGFAVSAQWFGDEQDWDKA